MPAASLGMALASLIEAKGADLEGASILMYSYGSGLAAGMFVLKGRSCAGKLNLQMMQSQVRSDTYPACTSCHVIGLLAYFAQVSNLGMLKCKC